MRVPRPRRIRLCALLVALAVPVLSAGPTLPGCNDYDDLHLTEAITKARELTASCLIAGGLNSAQGRRILSSGPTGPSYHCAYKLGDQARTSGDRKDVSVDLDYGKTRPPELTSVRELRSIDMTVFHEMLHVADPGNAREVTSYTHNHALGFPDAINGCEYACGGFIESDAPAGAYLLVFEGLVRPVPEDAAYACPKDSPDDCHALKKYAWLCRNGVPSLSEDESSALRLYEIALCLKDSPGVASEKSPLGDSLRRARSDAEAAGGNGDQRRARLLINTLRAVLDARDHGSLMDRFYLIHFLKEQGCPELP
jgi:hypothetical protein